MRLLIMERDHFKCEECGTTTATLNVHHGCYVPGYDPWEYPPGSLHTLCQPCHKLVQEKLSLVHMLICHMGLRDLSRLSDILNAINLLTCPEKDKDSGPSFNAAKIRPSSKPEDLAEIPKQKTRSEVLAGLDSEITVLVAAAHPLGEEDQNRLNSFRAIASVIRGEMEHRNA